MRTLLQVHGADVGRYVDSTLYERGEILRVLPEELERRNRTGGMASVDEYLADLDRTLDTLTESADALAAFIRERFPLGG